MSPNYSRILEALRKTKSSKKRPRRKPLLRLELLEPRVLMAANPFTPGDIVVVQVGNGTAQTTGDATQVYLDEYTAGGATLVQQIPLSTSTTGGNIALTTSGTASGAGQISLSPGGQELAIFGYNDSDLAANTTNQAESVGLLGANGTILYESSANNITTNANGVAISNSNAVYIGGNSGLYYADAFVSGTTNMTGANVGLGCASNLQIDNDLLFGSSSKSGGIYNFGNGSLPTGGVTPYELPTGTGTWVDGSNTAVTIGNDANGTANYTPGSPYGFFLANLGSGHDYDGYDTLYVADGATACGAILKYSYNANGNWTYDGGIEGLTSADSMIGITGTVSGTTVTLDMTAGGKVASGTDTDGGYVYTVSDNTGFGGNLSSLALSNAVQNSNSANIEFRGIAQVPDDGNGTLGGFAGTTPYAQGNAAIQIDSAATFADSSNFDGGHLTISGAITGDTLAVGNIGDISVSGNAVSYNGQVIGKITGNGAEGTNLVIAFDGIVANETSSNVVTGIEVQGLIDAISFSSAANSTAGNRTIAFNIVENNSNSASASQTVNVQASGSINPPTIGQNSNITINENSGLQTIDLSSIGANGATGQTLSVTATSANGALIANSSMTVNYTNPNSTGNVTFTPAANITGTDAITVTVSDSGGNTSETVDVTLAGPPSITAPSSVAAQENSSQIVSGISLTDSYVGSSNVQLTLTVGHGTLAVSTSVSGGLSSSGVAGNGTGSVTLTGTLTAINNTLTDSAGLTYTPSTSFTGSDKLSLTASDLGNTGSGAAQTATANVSLAVAALPAVLLNEIEANSPGGEDNRYQYVELRGTAGESLSNVYLVVFDGTAGDTGTADLVVNLSHYALGSDGLLVVQSSASTGHAIPPATTLVSDSAFFTQSGGFKNGSLSFFLYYSPNAAFTAGTDYDTNDDGTLDHLPSGATAIDNVAILNTNNMGGDIVYGNVEVTEQANQNLGTADAVTRFANNDSTANAAWYGGELFDVGNVDSTIAYDATRESANEPANAYLTPGADNYPEPPAFSPSSYSFGVQPTASTGTAVGTVSATAEGSDTLSYSLSGTGSANFDISSSGAITVASGATLSSSGYSLTAMAKDNQNNDTATAPVTIAVLSAPTVVGVFASGTDWDASYLSMLDAAGLGSPAASSMGFRLPDGATQLSTMLPWLNITQISIAFSEPVTVASSSLTIYNSANAVIPTSGFSYNSKTFIATWQFSALTANMYLLNLAADSVSDTLGTQLDGQWTTSASTFAAGSGDGTPGGDFNFYFNVLPGDANSSGAVTNTDVVLTNLQAGAVSNASNYMYDVNASGSITSTDVSIETLLLGSNITNFSTPQLPPASPSDALPEFAPDDPLAAAVPPDNSQLGSDAVVIPAAPAGGTSASGGAVAMASSPGAAAAGAATPIPASPVRVVQGSVAVADLPPDSHAAQLAAFSDTGVAALDSKQIVATITMGRVWHASVKPAARMLHPRRS